MDDELIVIRDVKELHMQEMENSRVDSIFILEEGMQFSPKFTTTKGMQFFPPRIVTTNLDFNENEIPRKPRQFIQLVEFAGLYCELTTSKSLYIDDEHNWNIEML